MSSSALWDEFLAVMARLRAPGGCPWDRRQTKESLKKYIIEEAYEVCEAVDAGDPEALAEELGDLLLQVVFQASIAAETGLFTVDTVLEKITAKLVRRHPHVFGDTVVSGPEEVLHNWEMIKKREKGRHSIFEGVPASLPALRRAWRIQQRAATVGFDWTWAREVVAKLKEEVDELEKAVISGDGREALHELGDVLFAAVNLGRHASVDPEESLNIAVERFVSRFSYIERRLNEQGRGPDKATIEEMDALWDEAKAEEERLSGGEMP